MSMMLLTGGGALLDTRKFCTRCDHVCRGYEDYDDHDDDYRDATYDQGSCRVLSLNPGECPSLPCRKESGVAERPPLDWVALRPF